MAEGAGDVVSPCMCQDGAQHELGALLALAKAEFWPPLPVTQLESVGAGQKGHLLSRQGTKARGVWAEGWVTLAEMNWSL